MTKLGGVSGLIARARGQYAPLLAALVGTLAVYPFLDDRSWVSWILTLTLLVVVVLSVLACWRRTRIFLAVIALGVFAQAFSAADQAMDMSYGAVVGNIFKFAFLLMVSGMVFTDVFRTKKVTVNTLFGACSVYLLMGLTWAAFYGVLEWQQPGSFTLTRPEGLDSGGWSNLLDAQLTYYSLVTLTTIGYGDITPVTTEARLISAMEGLLGQLFIAVVIARLVGLEISGRMGRSS